MRPVVAAWPYELRPWTGADLPWLYDAGQDPDVQRWTSVPSPFSLRDAVAFLRKAEDGWVSGTNLQLAIVSADNGLLLGHIVLKDLDWETGHGEVGYWLAPDARGRGVITVAVGALCTWAFEHIGLGKIELRASVGNLASQAVARRCGFAELGIEPSGGYDGDERCDNVVFVIRQDESPE